MKVHLKANSSNKQRTLDGRLAAYLTAAGAVAQSWPLKQRLSSLAITPCSHLELTARLISTSTATAKPTSKSIMTG